MAPSGRGFDVRIAQPDGRLSEKQLEVGTPPRLLRPIPAELREAIQFASDRPRFGVTPLGTSHGFDAAGDFTSFIIWIDGQESSSIHPPKRSPTSTRSGSRRWMCPTCS